MKIITRTNLIFPLVIIAVLSAAAQSVQPNTQSAMGDLWTICNVSERVIAITLSSITSIIGLVLGWCIFPLTIAPIAYIMRSELDIWGARLAMALGGGMCGFIFPFHFLLKVFSS